MSPGLVGKDVTSVEIIMMPLSAAGAQTHV